MGGGEEEARDMVRKEICSVIQADRSAVLKLKVQYRWRRNYRNIAICPDDGNYRVFTLTCVEEM